MGSTTDTEYPERKDRGTAQDYEDDMKLAARAALASREESK